MYARTPNVSLDLEYARTPSLAREVNSNLVYARTPNVALDLVYARTPSLARDFVLHMDIEAVSRSLICTNPTQCSEATQPIKESFL